MERSPRDDNLESSAVPARAVDTRCSNDSIAHMQHRHVTPVKSILYFPVIGSNTIEGTFLVTFLKSATRRRMSAHDISGVLK